MKKRVDAVVPETLIRRMSCKSRKNAFVRQMPCLPRENIGPRPTLG